MKRLTRGGIRPALTDAMLRTDSRGDRPGGIPRYAAGEGPTIIARTDPARHIGTAPGKRQGRPIPLAVMHRAADAWSRHTRIAVHHGEPLNEWTAQWPALVSTKLYWSVRLRARASGTVGASIQEVRAVPDAAPHCATGAAEGWKRRPTYRKDGTTPAGKPRSSEWERLRLRYTGLHSQGVRLNQEELDGSCGQMVLWLSREDVQMHEVGQ